MPRLVLPKLSVAPSVRAAARAHGDDFNSEYAADVASLPDEALEPYVDGLLADARPEAPRAAGEVPSTHLWWVEGDEFLGRVKIRHRLSPALREEAGHLGYHIVAGERRKGHASAMLSAALPVAAELGLECVLVLCDADNVASRRVIERNGGLFESRRQDKLRFWIPTVR